MSVSAVDPVPQEDASHSPLILEIPDRGGEGVKEIEIKRSEYVLTYFYLAHICKAVIHLREHRHEVMIAR